MSSDTAPTPGGLRLKLSVPTATLRSVASGTFAWIARYRRLTIRYERLVAMHRAFLHLGCALICFNYLQRL